VKDAGTRNRNTREPITMRPALAWRPNNGPALEVRWNDVDAETLRSAVDSVTCAGSAVILGRTRDGGAFSVVVLTDTDKIKEYPHGVEETNALLREIANYFTN